MANSGLTGLYKPIQRWTGTNWTTVSGTDLFDPLEAYYLYVIVPGKNLILMVNSSDAHPYCMPVRPIVPGWTLWGPNPLFPMPDMPVDAALSSVAMTAGGDPGYTQCISPNVQCQMPWIYTPGMTTVPDVVSGRGYWLWSLNIVDLVGFGFTPLPAGP
jgi:hypothetical protein